MASSGWDHLGDIANVAQLTGLDAVRLIALIVRAASSARMHKRNCRQFARHLKLIGNLLEQLRVAELRRYPETREPLEQLEDALRRSYVLVDSCRDRSYLYLLAMGWSIVYQFRKAQSEIDRYLKIVPLISLVDNSRVREKLEYIERDECEYTFDEEDRKVQAVILRQDPSIHQELVLKKTLSTSYPNLPFDKAIQKENEKLQLELERSQLYMDIDQCEIIQYLLSVTESIANSFNNATSHLENYGYSPDGGSYYSQESSSNTESRSVSTVSPSQGLISRTGSRGDEDWHSDLLGCCSEPTLCIKTFFYPCGTFSKIATVAEDKEFSSADACNDLMAYTIICSCCCYTCCIRRKLRKMLNIKGGCCDDFLSHLMCCCCALVQEWREVEIRGIYGQDMTKTTAPQTQFMTY